MAEPSDAPTTATSTILEEDPSAATEVYNNVKVSLADLCAKGTSHYAHKNYNEAADCYARASELQAELNGEMDPDNAEILFLYGRSLFRVGQSKSDVLGGRGGDKNKSNGAAKTKKAAKDAVKLDPVAEEGVALVAEKSENVPKQEDDAGPKKPLFQFTGDENFDDSDDTDEVSYLF
jgi:HAT1-interacting factor 1